jgi:predicted MPP superfamily phosphohydrolase
MSQISLNRRDFLKRSLSTMAVAPTLSLHSNVSSQLKVETVSISVPQLAQALIGLRIGFLSDIHLCAFLPAQLLEDALSALNQANVDLLLLGGDYIWQPRELLRDSFPVFRPEFSNLQDPNLVTNIYESLITQTLAAVSPPLGIHAVMGNHDHWLQPALCKRIFAKSAINLLINQRSQLVFRGNPIEVYGCDDYLTGLPKLINPTTRAADENTSNKTLRILLTHNPDLLPWFFKNSPRAFDLAFMGHTHGGQICPYPGVALSYNIQNRQFGQGLYHHPTGCQCYTSRGLGTVGIPLRVNCPPEVTIITLQ